MGDQIPDLISVSIVSHGHAELAAQLFDDLRVHKPNGIEVILTLNIEEALPFDPDSFPFCVKTIRNASPRGFAANHNAAFGASGGNFFCVLNPDIRVHADPFLALVRELGNPTVGAAAPLILDDTTRSARKASLRIGWAACSCCFEGTLLPR